MYGEFERKVWVLNQSGDMGRGEGVINGTITLVDDQAVPIDFGGGGATAWNDITGVPAALTAAQAAGTASIRAIGTTATTSAAGNHTHAFSAITGTLAIGQIPTGTSATTVALGNHTHAAATTSAAGFMAAADKTKLNGCLNLVSAAPASSTATGAKGDYFYGAEALYICVAANTWRQVILTTW